eukprot:CAMPEP_0170528698 /NCGR_PEP_ID=MMETSP0209-20121228/14189_1 /TAXON_ID=665100 ORGANISM="Litonotus pictus, Strain P1" /NCGR_SAMPLE_ID=MMETSP0209 /ASSEMBLY_ACC=CAM_ASM_000301 /LENGTH=53 /DNA_ID=CAMNT_0010820079 /DNA_START=150 /DNA_END=311 /DNA_ORIENTATION=+
MELSTVSLDIVLEVINVITKKKKMGLVTMMMTVEEPESVLKEFAMVTIFVKFL